METFWMIWNKKGTAPKVRHTDIRAAKCEAERLARLNPGERFIVLEAIGSCIKRDVEWDNEPRIPI
jgi:hypothetical protein